MDINELPETVPTAGDPVQTEPPVQQTEPPVNTPTDVLEKTFTKNQVVEMMKKRISRSHSAFFKRYGVENLDALDSLFENAHKFNEMNGEFGKIQLRNSELVRENSFLRNNINPDKYADIIAHFKGNGVEFSEEELIKALTNHPEWLKPTVPATTIKTLGSETHTLPTPNEAEKASKLLGVKL